MVISLFMDDVGQDTNKTDDVGQDTKLRTITTQQYNIYTDCTDKIWFGSVEGEMMMDMELFNMAICN